MINGLNMLKNYTKGDGYPPEADFAKAKKNPPKTRVGNLCSSDGNRNLHFVSTSVGFLHPTYVVIPTVFGSGGSIAQVYINGARTVGQSTQ